MGNPILEVSHLNSFYTSEGFLRGRKARRSQVLHDVSFTVEEGDIVGLVGESGSGKSTLARCVLGMIKDWNGEIRHHTKYPQMVFQDPFSSLAQPRIWTSQTSRRGTLPPQLLTGKGPQEAPERTVLR